MCTFDIIIPTGPEDVAFVPRVVDYVYRCFENLEHIYVLTAKKNFSKIEKKIPANMPYKLIDENDLLPNLSFQLLPKF